MLLGSVLVSSFQVASVKIVKRTNTEPEKMRISVLLLTLLIGCLMSRGTWGKPIEMDDTIVSIVARAVGGSDKDKTEAISIILELLAEIDLPSLCQSINSKSSPFTRVDDIIARAATSYGVTPPSVLVSKSEKELDTKTSVVQTNDFSKGLPRKEASMADSVKAPYRTPPLFDNQIYANNIQTVADDYHLTKIHPVPQEFPDYNKFVLPGNDNYEFYDVNDNLVYDISAAAVASSPDSDVTKYKKLVDKSTKERSALFFPENLLPYPSMLEDTKHGFDDVIIRGESLKPNSQLYAENLKMEKVDVFAPSTTNPITDSTTPFATVTTRTQDMTSPPPTSNVSDETEITEYTAEEDISTTTTVTIPTEPLSQHNTSAAVQEIDISTPLNNTVLPSQVDDGDDAILGTTTTTASTTSATTTTTTEPSTATPVISTTRNAFTEKDIPAESKHTNVSDTADDRENLDLDNVRGNHSDNKSRATAELYHSLKISSSSSDRDSVNNTNILNNTAAIQINTTTTEDNTIVNTTEAQTTTNASTTTTEDIVNTTEAQTTTNANTTIENIVNTTEAQTTTIANTTTTEDNIIVNTTEAETTTKANTTTFENIVNTTEAETTTKANTTIFENIVNTTEAETTTKANTTIFPVNTVSEEATIAPQRSTSTASNQTFPALNTTSADTNQTSPVHTDEQRRVTDSLADKTELNMTDALAVKSAATALNASTEDTSKETVPLTKLAMTNSTGNVTGEKNASTEDTSNETVPLTKLAMTNSTGNVTGEKNSSSDVVQTAARGFNTSSENRFMTTDTSTTLNSDKTSDKTPGKTLNKAHTNNPPHNDTETTTVVTSVKSMLKSEKSVTNLKTMLESERSMTTDPSNEASETTSQLTTSTRHATDFHTTKSSTADLENLRTTKPDTEVDHEPELQWWKPITDTARKIQQKQKEVAQLANNGKGSRMSLEPFSRWAGRQVADRWSRTNNKRIVSAAAASQNSGMSRKRFYGEKGPNFHTYSVDLHEDHTHEPRWENYLNAKYTRASVDDRKRGFLPTTVPSTSVQTLHGDKVVRSEESNTPKRASTRFYPSFNFRPTSQPWSPFNPQFIYPNLGTLWGLNSNPRNVRYDRGTFRNQKFNDMSGPSYIHPGLNDFKTADSKSSKSSQNEVSYKVPKDESAKVSQTALNRLGLRQKTIWSEMATRGRLEPRYKGYACPGLFGYFGDIVDCRSFFICSWGVPYRFYCPSGTLWNPSESVCDWSRNVQCSKK